ncbi:MULTISPECIES: hypothetical protein [Bacteria]|uniref:hypothetical protein n=1 Tax=Bacteria TaxID=2 RepID=UPI003C7B7E57
MYILLAIIAACALGIAVHFLVPSRGLRGLAVAPAVSTAVAAVAYTIGQWSGLGENSLWLWLLAIGGGVAASVAATVTLTAMRRRSDAAQRAALGI